MDIKQINQFLEENKLPKFRLKQILKAVCTDSVSSFSEISTLPKDLREKMDKEIDILSFEPEEIQSDKKDGSQKVLLKLSDGNFIETVLMPGVNENHWTACISSQVGCAMGCSFCATGTMGFKRNLNYEEIIDQVLFWKQYLSKNKPEDTLANIVYMGMGEPFMNWDEVSKSIHKLLDESLFNFSARHISVSTSGIADKIKRFAKEFPQLNLAVSLIFPNNEIRSEHMPVNKKFDLRELAQAINYYLMITNRKIFLEYVLFEGVNDEESHAQELAAFIKHIEKKQLVHINLIRYNTTDAKFKSSTREKTIAFQKYLSKYKIFSTVRKSIGGEINAACGQLAGKIVDNPKNKS
ncbi:MAG: 23S rRNA (adenine(2503)-C(2))-methyltransferase RlmN [Patescibacteria group bacterium]|jgi:23S rRNA (adenine2503-C2)-methyltransferase|nr:23S rRNA (adenine(2503)-C(2))-methyltransferase RlmN [Patescibacteria group bacterium]